MNSTRSYNVQLTHFLELWPNTECEILVEARVETADFAFGGDADGRREETRTEVSTVDIHTLLLYVPNRPSLRLFKTEQEIAYFLTKPEMDNLVDLACRKVFIGEAEEV